MPSSAAAASAAPAAALACRNTPDLSLAYALVTLAGINATAINGASDPGTVFVPSNAAVESFVRAQVWLAGSTLHNRAA